VSDQFSEYKGRFFCQTAQYKRYKAGSECSCRDHPVCGRHCLADKPHKRREEIGKGTSFILRASEKMWAPYGP
jgi:hypothetical protein